MKPWGGIGRAALVMVLVAAFVAGAAGPASAAKAKPAPRATAPPPHPAPAPDSVAWRAIAIAEDERRLADGVLTGCLAHPDSLVRARAALAIGRIQDSTSVGALLPLLHDASASVRGEAVFALGQIGHRSARAALDSLLGRSERGLERLAIEALGKIGDHASTGRVAAMLQDPAPELRGEAAVALWRLADSTALDALIARHEDPDPEVRWRVLYALEKIVAPARIVLVAALHADDPEWLTRAQAVRTLGRQKAPRGTAYVIQKLTDPEPAVIVNAIRALQLIADTTCASCLPALVEDLGHRNPYVRVTAAGALADRFGWATADSTLRRVALDSLAAHLADPDAATRGTAARALLARVQGTALTAVRPMLSDTALEARVQVIRALAVLPAAQALPILLERIKPSVSLPERVAALDAMGTLKSRDAAVPLRAALSDTAMLVVASAASALSDLGDSSSVPALGAAYRALPARADADVRVSIRDALRTLAGRAYADSVERLSPPPPVTPTYAADFERPSTARGALLHTSRGDIEWAFYNAEATQTVKNFVRLAERGYFDGLRVHRVVPNFVIQDGDPTGTGAGGPGYTIRCEYNALRYDAGMVGMALSGKDTGGSQWFITHSPQMHLNGRYTIFARVTRGMDVVQSIVQGDRILRVEILR